MNIVDAVKSELGPDVLGKLSALVGEGEGGLKAAIDAAVPGLLSLLSRLASTGAGSETLVNALKQVQQDTPDSQGGFGDILSGPQAREIGEKGGGLIKILLGSAALPVILNLLSRFARISPEAVKKLLGYLAPLILSVIAKQFSGRSLRAEDLSGFFAEQKGNIGSAMPAGFSLAEIPGLGAVSTAAGPAASGGGLPNWLLPLVGLGLLGLVAWWFLGQAQEPIAGNPAANAPPRPGPAPDPAVKVSEAAAKAQSALPDATKLGTDLGSIYGSLTELLGGVKDAPTAEAAATKVSDLTPKLDGLKAIWDKLPEASRASVAKVTTDHLGKLKELIAKVLALPGVSEKLKPTLDAMLARLAAFATG